MIDSPCWSSFRELMEMADEMSADSRIEGLIDSRGIILFFEKDGDVFGTGEEGRIAFAKLKNPDEDDPKLDDDAGFSATNLSKEVRGESSLHVINKTSIKDVKVIDKDEAVEKLKKESAKAGDKAFPKSSNVTVLGFDQLAKMLSPEPSTDEGD